MWSDWSNVRGWVSDTTSVAIRMLDHNVKGGISGQYTFNGKKWNPCLEVERPHIIQCKEVLLFFHIFIEV